MEGMSEQVPSLILIVIWETNAFITVAHFVSALVFKWFFLFPFSLFSLDYGRILRESYGK